MAKFLTGTIKKVLVGVAMVTSLAVHAETSSGNSGLWQEVRQAGELRCGAAVAAPYVMRDAATGEYSGFFVDLCRDFAENVLKVEATFVNTSWDNIVAGLQSNQWDLAMALNQTPERALAIAFSTPAVDYQVSLLINKDNPKFADAGSNLADFDKRGVTFAVMSGTAQDRAITAALQNASIMRLPGMDETRLALMSRRADVLADASDTNHLFALANPDWTQQILPDPALAKQGVSFGLRRTISHADLQVLDIYLSQRRATGEIQALVDAASAQVNAEDEDEE